MKRLHNAAEQTSQLLETPQSEEHTLLRAGAVSLFFHAVIIIFLIFYLKLGGPNGGGGGGFSICRVTIHSLSAYNNSNPSPAREFRTSQGFFSKKQIEKAKHVSIDKINQSVSAAPESSPRDAAKQGQAGFGSGGGGGEGEGWSGFDFLGLRGFGRSGMSSPRYIENQKPEYPLEAQQKGYEGKVLLKLEVLPNGRVGEVQLEKSSGYEVLDRSALVGVKKWRFIPAKKGTVAIRSLVNILITFQLRDYGF